MLAQSAAHLVCREAMALKLAVLGRQMEAKQKRLLALQSAADMEGAKSKYMLELQKERDTLAKEKTALLQVSMLRGCFKRWGWLKPPGTKSCACLCLCLPVAHLAKHAAFFPDCL